jgi:hypothetical protein
MAEQNDQTVKKLSDVSSKLSTLNATTTAKLNNMESLTETLIEQNRSGLLASAEVARSEEETRKEASRARKGKTIQDVHIVDSDWQPDMVNESGGMFSGLMDLLKLKFLTDKFSLGSLFGKGGFKKLITTFGATVFGGFKVAFASIGTTFSSLLGPTIMKFLGPGALIAGLAWAIYDGVTGWMSSSDWGVSKISGFLGGFFGGKADGGIKNAFMGMGKWALIGAGMGSVVPVIGTLLGGLVGAAIGGVLGLIGGKKIAKAFDSVGKWFMSKWTGVSKYMKELWGKVIKWFTGLWNWASGGIAAGWMGLTAYLSEKWLAVKTWFTGLWNWASEGIAAGWTNLTDYVSGIWTSVKAWITGIFSWGKAAGATDDGGWSLMTFIYGPEGIVTKVKNWFKGIFAWGKEAGATDEGGWSLMTFMYGPEGVVTKIKAWVGNLLSFKGVDGEQINIVEKVTSMFRAMIDKLVISVKAMIEKFTPDWLKEDKDIKDMSKTELQDKAKSLKKDIKSDWTASPLKQMELNKINARLKQPDLAKVNTRLPQGEYMQATQSLAELKAENNKVKRTPSGSNAPIIVNQSNTNNASNQGVYIPPPPVIVQNQNRLPGS